MKNLSIILAVSLIAAFMLVTGCAKKAVEMEAAAAAEEEAPKAAEPVAAPEPMPEPEPEAAAPKMAEPEPVRLEAVYFDFDRYAIRGDALSTLNRNADVLKVNPDLRVTVEGHCDERGTSEYNLALGEKRANAVKSYLVNRGVNGSRVSTISYGSEKPTCLAHNEGCWQENRKARFKW